MRGERREIEAVGFDDKPLLVAPSVALAVRAVLHGDQAELDQAAVDGLDLRRREAERLLLHGGRWPDDRPAPLPQSCGWVNRNSQSMACTRRGERPSLGAAAFKAASNCPGA